MRIEESEMIFGEYNEDDVFRIEKSRQYRELKTKGVKSCEFIMLRGKTLYFLEAKKSNPKELVADTDDEKRRKYCEYIDDIIGKMIHSILLYENLVLHRYDVDGISKNLMLNDLQDYEIKLVLVAIFKLYK